jgi:hypothetical protein
LGPGQGDRQRPLLVLVLVGRPLRRLLLPLLWLCAALVVGGCMDRMGLGVRTSVRASAC